MTYRVIFMGTPEFAVPTLKSLVATEDFNIVGVVTQPDRPAGRGKQVRESAIKQVAVAHDLSIFQPENLRSEPVLEQLVQWQPDVYVVVAYGQILRRSVLEIPRYGSVNVHGSLLPRWRGASPIQAAIRAGDAESGLTIMRMDEGMDTGPMLLKRAVPLAQDETAQSLHDKLAAMSGDLLLEALRGYLSGEIEPQPQDDALATYAPLIQKDDGNIDWTQTAREIDQLVRAMTPWPGAFTYWDGTLLKIKSGRPFFDSPTTLPPGEVSLDNLGTPLVIGTGDGLYAPEQLQLAGRKTLDVIDFVNGNQSIAGAVLRRE